MEGVGVGRRTFQVGVSEITGSLDSRTVLGLPPMYAVQKELAEGDPSDFMTFVAETIWDVLDA